MSGVEWKSLKALLTVNEEIIRRIDKTISTNSSHSFFCYHLHHTSHRYSLQESQSLRTAEDITSSWQVTVTFKEIPEFFQDTPKNVAGSYAELKEYLQGVIKLLGRAEGFMGDMVQNMPIVPILLKNMEIMQVHLGDLEGKFLVQESQKELYQRKVDQLNTLLQEILSYPSLQWGALGYSSTAIHHFQIGEFIWLCVSKGSCWEDLWKVCNEEQGFHLASVNTIKLLGLPDKEKWSSASQFLKEKGFKYVVTGQPVRGANWENCENLGFVAMGEELSGPNWKELYSGNGEAGREWPNAASPAYGNLVSLVINVSHFKGTYVKNHVWRCDN